MPVYHGDKAFLFRRALNSVLHNSCIPDQIVLVIDGPIDRELESTIDDLRSDRFKIIRIKENLGLTNALNLGIDECDHEYVARCDSDDENVENRFELQLKAFMNDEKLSLCGGQIIEIAEDEEFHRKVPCSAPEISKFIKLRNPFNHMTVMYKKNDVIEAGKYPNIPYREDYALWIKLFAMKKKMINVQYDLVFANAGNEMYQRRGKPRDITYEIELQKFIYQHHVVNIFQMCVNLIVRSSNMLISPKLRRMIYTKFLRY